MGDEACGAKTESQTESGMEAELDMHEIHGGLDIPWGLFQLGLSSLIMCKVGRIINIISRADSQAAQGVPLPRITFHQS